MRLNHLMSLLEMENSIFKDIVLCYAALRSSATIAGTLGSALKSVRVEHRVISREMRS